MTGRIHPRRTARRAVPATLLATLLATTGLARAEETAGLLVRDFMGRPTDISLDGHRSDWLFDVTTLSVSLLFVIMVGIILFVLSKHRKGHQAHYDHGVGGKSLVQTAIISSIIFFGVDGTLLVNSFLDLHNGFWKFPKPEENPIQIEVMAQQWAWNVRYPGPDNKFNTADDIVTLNDVRIPVGKPVLVKLRSKDVIHSFYLPNFRTKQDAIPGTTTKIWFQATRPGAVEIGCAQHCGVHHYRMRGALTAMDEKEYASWYEGAVADARRKFDPNDPEALWGWDWESK